MSISKNSNNGPLISYKQSNSQRSLYSEHSYDSNLPSPNQKHKKQTKIQEPISNKFNNLVMSKIKPNHLVNNKIAGVQYQHDYKQHTKPQIQKQTQNKQYRGLLQEEAKNSKHKLFTNFNTINVAPKQSQFGLNRYNQNSDQQPFKPKGFVQLQSNQRKSEYRSSFYAEKQRMLRSSQGGRWFRSQSLMQNQETRSHHNGLQLRNFYPHGSKHSQQMENFLKHYYLISKQLQTKWSKYKFSILDTLQDIKNKMQSFLQKKIDLSNIPIDRPDIDWGQQRLSDFYKNYEPILIAGLQKDDIKQNSAIVMKKYKNCVYYGPIVNGKKHGFGYLHYFSGRFFQGRFEEDQKCQGFQMDDSQLYLGNFKKNQRHGEGILKTNQYMLVGIFTNGRFISPKQFINNQLEKHENYEGFKILFSSMIIYNKSPVVVSKHTQGDIYIGQVRDDDEIKQGLGLDIFANGDIYIGRYQQGVPQGYGEYYWQSGAFYRGQFLSGMRHGKGIWMMVNGDKYQGQYMNDKKNGKGIYTWKAGDCYEGQFQNDYRHGYGQMRWRDGKFYKGKWSNGIQINKVIKLEQNNPYKLPKANPIKNKTQATRSSIKTLQPKKRGNITKTSFSRHGKQSKLDSFDNNSRKVPLEKLKAMLNPTNNIN